MNRSSKEQMVAELVDQLAGANAAFLADYRGLNVEKVNQLRTELRNAGAEYRVVKNTLLRLAAKGTTVECLDAELAGPTALTLVSGDPVAPAKVLSEFAKNNDKFQLKAGALEGKRLSIEDIKALAELPSREVLLGRLLGTLNAPVSNFVGVLAAVPRSLVQALAAIQDKKAA
ncbi:50S ribosomal protein L10 [Geoalkalibacter sp.]|uniref:50S ribosomal protein L10 n=1 Tax=Geoalkalibacter sp. TaxID=3041440 RepID=UPI00272DCD77|nr:50S ribosomal protein L10 [Geoalkalibacter sp.]